MSESSCKEECKTKPPKYSEKNNSLKSEEVSSIEKYTGGEINDLISEAGTAVYSQRKSYGRKFKYKSISEYFIKKKLYGLDSPDLNDPLLSEYELLSFDEFKEFASDPRWKNQIDISSQNKIKAKLVTEKNGEIFTQIKNTLCDFEAFELRIHDQEHGSVNSFLANYFPANCEYFKLSCEHGKHFQINYYFDSIIKLNNKVTDELYILSWKLSQDQMVTIFKEFKHLRSLKIIDGTIDLESVPELGDSLEGSNIKDLALGGNVYGDNGYGVEHLIEGLSQSNSFLQNLNTINLYKSKIGEEDVKEKTQEYVDIEKLSFMPPENNMKELLNKIG